ncbi:MAG: erythromycin esterase family protein [Armatimonadetes bacterium]|nr:erythromycin esterase family protein [Armatimonadota bacterium]
MGHLLLALSLSVQLCNLNGANDGVVDSLRSASVPLKTVVAGNGFEDMAPLAKSLEGVEVVGMGEPTHGSREVFQMKHRMFEYLVENHGFTVFALESSMPDTIAMDRYVLHGEGSSKDAAKNQGFWTWATEEVVDLLEWMREYNEDDLHKQKLRVVGIDMHNQAMSTIYFQRICQRLNGDSQALYWEEMSWDDPTDEQMKKFVEIVVRDLPLVRDKDGVEAARMYERMAVVFRQAVYNNRIREFNQIRLKVVPLLSATFKSVGQLLEESENLPEDAEKGLAFLAEHADKRVQAESVDPDVFKKYAAAIRQYARSQEDMAEEYTNCADLLDFLALVPRISGLNVRAHRDQSMAENLVWIGDTYLPGARVMLWAHNYHVSRLFANDKQFMTGAFLAESFGDKYFPVGFSFYEGAFQARSVDGSLKEWTVPAARSGSLDTVLNSVGPDRFFIDFDQLDKSGSAWAARTHATRNYGAVNNESQANSYWGEIVPSALYGGMIFIRKTTRARPIKQ